MLIGKPVGAYGQRRSIQRILLCKPGKNCRTVLPSVASCTPWRLRWILRSYVTLRPGSPVRPLRLPPLDSWRRKTLDGIFVDFRAYEGNFLVLMTLSWLKGHFWTVILEHRYKLTRYSTCVFLVSGWSLTEDHRSGSYNRTKKKKFLIYYFDLKALFLVDKVSWFFLS